MFRYLCVFVGLLNSHWVRGEVEKDSMSTFYEMVSSLSGDQPPVVMVGFYELVITFIFVMIKSAAETDCSVSPDSLESQRSQLYSHPARWTLLGRIYEDGSISVHCCWVSEQVNWRSVSVFIPILSVVWIPVTSLWSFCLCTTCAVVLIVAVMYVSCRLVALIKDYCGSVCEKTVRMNFALIYELLDEMVVSHTHFFILIFFIHCKSRYLCINMIQT